jgi:hypothetical protein
MKRLYTLITLVLLLISFALSGQINLNKLKIKANEALGNAIERKIDEELNKAADRIVDKYWDRVIGKYYAGLYEGSGSASGGFPFVLSEDVELAESYAFQRIVKIKIDTYKKNGKLKETMMMNTHTTQDGTYMGTEIEDEESQKKDQTLFIINDFGREAFVMLMQSEGEKSRLAYKLIVEEAALEEAENEGMASTEETPSDVSFENLGTRDINGYSCKGYGYDTEDGYTEIWVTNDDIFGMQNMFNINQSSFQQNVGSLPDDYPKGSVIVGMTGFEPATTRPPDEYSTGLSYIPISFKYLFAPLPFIFFSRSNASERLSTSIVKINSQGFPCFVDGT